MLFRDIFQSHAVEVAKTFVGGFATAGGAYFAALKAAPHFGIADVTAFAECVSACAAAVYGLLAVAIMVLKLAKEIRGKQ